MADRIEVSRRFAAVTIVLSGAVAASLWGATQHFYKFAAIPVSFDPLVRPEVAPAVGPFVERQLRSGETLSQALDAVGLSPGDAQAAVHELSRFVDPRRLKPGDVYRARYAALPVPSILPVEAVEMRLAGRGEVRLARRAGGAGWEATFRAVERSLRPRFVQGTLDQSLEQAVRAAGAEPALAYAMADVLAWDLDFNRDLRRGDTFRVLYSEEYVDGVFDGVGPIAALIYENAGRRHEAYRFADRGYYDTGGEPLQKMFLRSPLKFSRVTSGFTHRRFHPVLKTYRPHWGVDYGAPVGTPVLATAHGTVTHAAWEGGGGRVIKVRHASGYVSCYLHLSRYAAGIKPGRKVRQGEVIGYVGSSGLATGPHLDYRVQSNGRWINPLSISNARAEPLAKAELASFRAWATELRAALDAGQAPGSIEGTAGGTLLAQVPGSLPGAPPAVGAAAPLAAAGLADTTARR